MTKTVIFSIIFIAGSCGFGDICFQIIELRRNWESQDSFESEYLDGTVTTIDYDGIFTDITFHSKNEATSMISKSTTTQKIFPVDFSRASNESRFALETLFDKLKAPPEKMENIEKQTMPENVPFTLQAVWFELCVICMVVLSLIFNVFIYYNIYKQVAWKRSANARRMTKLFKTTLIFIGAFVIWLVFNQYIAL